MDNCPDYGKIIDQETKAIYCSICKSWLHKLCSNVTDEQYTEVTSSPEPFYCHICISENLPTNLVSLGNECVSEESLSEIVADCLEINSNYHDLNSFLNSIMSNKKPDDICIFHTNIRSLRENIDKLSNMLSTMQKPPHIVAVSETKINKNDGCHFQLL